MNYQDIVLKDERNNVCIDFDGVIHNDYKGFDNGTIYGNIIPGALEALQLLAQKYKVIIFTAKAKPDRPHINGKTGTELVWEWLKQNNLDTYVSEVTSEKPRALVYIDDKAIRFVDWQTTLNTFTQLYESK